MLRPVQCDPSGLIPNSFFPYPRIVSNMALSERDIAGIITVPTLILIILLACCCCCCNPVKPHGSTLRGRDIENGPPFHPSYPPGSPRPPPPYSPNTTHLPGPAPPTMVHPRNPPHGSGPPNMVHRPGPSTPQPRMPPNTGHPPDSRTPSSQGTTSVVKSPGSSTSDPLGLRPGSPPPDFRPQPPIIYPPPPPGPGYPVHHQSRLVRVARGGTGGVHLPMPKTPFDDHSFSRPPPISYDSFFAPISEADTISAVHISDMKGTYAPRRPRRARRSSRNGHSISRYRVYDSSDGDESWHDPLLDGEIGGKGMVMGRAVHDRRTMYHMA